VFSKGEVATDAIAAEFAVAAAPEGARGCCRRGKWIAKLGEGARARVWKRWAGKVCLDDLPSPFSSTPTKTNAQGSPAPLAFPKPECFMHTVK
jgi:hypothetical protein